MTPLGVRAEAAAPGSANEAVVETICAAVVLVVPGYVLGRVAGRAGREPDATDRGMAVRLAADSILVHTAMMPLTFLLADSVLRHGAAGYGIQIFLWLAGVCLVLPAALGGCGLWLSRRDPDTSAGAVARVLGYAPSNRFVYAWSAMLTELPRQPKGALARVLLRDGREIAGYYARWGRAADDPVRHDLYLDLVFKPDPPSARYPVSGGIWINGDDIVTVEFFLAQPRPGRRRSESVDEQPKPEAPEPQEPKPITQQRARAHGGTGVPDTEQEPAKAPVPEQPTGEREKGGK